MNNQSITAIMILSSYCNLDCTYCYALKGLEQPRGTERMSVDVAEESMSQLLKLPVNRIDLNWHGGEPLIIGRKHFKKILEKQRDLVKGFPQKKIYNKLQTNGTLVGEKWIELFREYQIGVGVSIDGPDYLHNRQRPLPQKQESFEFVYRGITLLDNAGIPGGKLLVITPSSLLFVDDIFEFCKEHLRDVDIIPCFHVDKATQKVIQPTISPAQYGNFLINLFDLWFQEDDPKFYIRFFNDTIKSLLGGCPTLCSLSKGCQSFITIDWNGDVYPCDNFSGYREFFLGNILKQTLTEILASDKYVDILDKMTAIPDDCHDCGWLNVCKGGCSHQSFMPGKDFNNQNFFCLSRQMFFEHVSQELGMTNFSFSNLQ